MRECSTPCSSSRRRQASSSARSATARPRWSRPGAELGERPGDGAAVVGRARCRSAGHVHEEAVGSGVSRGKARSPSRRPRSPAPPAGRGRSGRGARRPGARRGRPGGRGAVIARPRGRSRSGHGVRVDRRAERHRGRRQPAVSGRSTPDHDGRARRKAGTEGVVVIAEHGRAGATPSRPGKHPTRPATPRVASGPVIVGRGPELAAVAAVLDAARAGRGPRSASRAGPGSARPPCSTPRRGAAGDFLASAPPGVADRPRARLRRRSLDVYCRCAAPCRRCPAAARGARRRARLVRRERRAGGPYLVAAGTLSLLAAAAGGAAAAAWSSTTCSGWTRQSRCRADRSPPAGSRTTRSRAGSPGGRAGGVARRARPAGRAHGRRRGPPRRRSRDCPGSARAGLRATGSPPRLVDAAAGGDRWQPARARSRPSGT